MGSEASMGKSEPINPPPRCRYSRNPVRRRACVHCVVTEFSNVVTTVCEDVGYAVRVRPMLHEQDTYTNRSATVLLLSVLPVCVTVCLSVCQHDNSRTVRDIIAKF